MLSQPHPFLVTTGLLVGAILSGLTTLPWLTSILLTDIFAGLAVLAVHLLVFSDGALRRWERHALVALIAFAGIEAGRVREGGQGDCCKNDSEGKFPEHVESPLPIAHDLRHSVKETAERSSG